MVEWGVTGGLKVMVGNKMGNKGRKLRGNKAVDGLEDQNKMLVVDVGGEQQSPERCEEFLVHMCFSLPPPPPPVQLLYCSLHKGCRFIKIQDTIFIVFFLSFIPSGVQSRFCNGCNTFMPPPCFSLLLRHQVPSKQSLYALHSPLPGSVCGPQI